MHSCIYEGKVEHRRRQPVNHAFQYSIFMIYLDLKEIRGLVGPRRPISRARFASASFHDDDHLLGQGVANQCESLEQNVRSLIQRQTGVAARGPIRLLTQLRYFGLYFSPLNLYFAFDEHEQKLETVVAEVSNTPWNEKRHYLLWNGNRYRDGAPHGFRHPKDFHVSPFLPMEMEYRWRIGDPGQQLAVHVECLADAAPVFSAGMVLERRPLTRQQLRRMSWRYPVMSFRILSAIYYQALKLWWKKCPFYAHPQKLARTASPLTD